MARHTQGAAKRSGRIFKRPGSSARSAYVYAVLVDGVVRYVGRGRNGRMNTHLIEAKRSAARCAPDTSGLYPRMHRKLVEAVRAGSQVTESVIVSGLTDKAAYRLESWIIGEFHKYRAGPVMEYDRRAIYGLAVLAGRMGRPRAPALQAPAPPCSFFDTCGRSKIAAPCRASCTLAASAWERRGRTHVRSDRFIATHLMKRRNFLPEIVEHGVGR